MQSTRAFALTALPPRKSMRFAVLCTAVFAALAHGYRALCPGFSGDSMLISQAGEEIYQISLGRFMQPVYWQIRGVITAPMLIVLLSTVYLMLACALIVRLLSLRRPLPIALLCGVLVTNETLSASFATYLPWTDVYMLAFLLCALGVYAFEYMRGGFFLSAVLFALSVGLYQSYIQCAAVLFILVFMRRLLTGEDVPGLWLHGVRAVMSMVLGLALYALLLRLVLPMVGADASMDYNGVGRVGYYTWSSLPSLILDTYLAPIRFFLDPTGDVMTWHSAVVPRAAYIALAVCMMPLLLSRLGHMKRSAALTFLFLLLMLPLGMNIVEFVSVGVISGLTIYSYFLALALPLLLLPGETSPSHLYRLCAGASCALLCGIVAVNIGVSNQMYLKRDLEWSATTSAMTRLIDRIEETEGYVPGETPVVIIGMLPSSSISMERSGFERISDIQGMRYTYAASYETAHPWYFLMAMGYPINLMEPVKGFDSLPEHVLSQLSRFPSANCIRLIDGTLYVHLS